MANITYTTQDLIDLALKKNLLSQEKLTELTELKIVDLDREKFLDKMQELGLFTETASNELKRELLILSELDLFNSNPTLIKQHNELSVENPTYDYKLSTQDNVQTIFTQTSVEKDPLKTFATDSKNTISRDTLFSTSKKISSSRNSLSNEEKNILKKIGRYEVFKLLGQGGMGSVYKAYDVALDRYVALKFIHNNDSGAKQRLILEGRTQARVDHPSICKIYEIGEIGSEIFVAMQYIEGNTLAKVAKELSLEEKLKLVIDIAEGLDAAHKQGLVHRDIKPQNIMVEKKADGTLQVSILDFGLVKEVSSKGMTVTGEILGTPSYMSPEQASGQVNKIDRRTDIYSLGVTLYEILVHRLPFEGINPMDILFKVLNKEAPTLRQIDPSIAVNLETIVAKCLEKDPQRRYKTAKDLAEDLRRFLGGSAIQARPVTLSYRIFQKARNHKTAVISIILTFAIIIVAAISNLRTRLNAAEQAFLAQEFGQKVKDIEQTMLIGNLLPLHDLSREKNLVKRQIADIKQQMQKLGKVSAGPGNYALGQGYLVLHDYAKAKEHLEIALASGYNSPEFYYSLGQTLGALYQEALMETERITNSELRKAREEQIEKELRDPALLYLRTSKTSTNISPSYAEGLIAFYEKNYEKALEKAQKAFTEIPFLFEAKKLEGDIYIKLGDLKREKGNYPQAKEAYSKAGEAYKLAVTIGESADSIYEGECDQYSKIMDVGIITNDKELYQTAYKDAISACDKALIANPESSPVYRKKSRVLWRLGEEVMNTNQDPTEYFDKAVATAKKAVFYDNKDAYAYNNLGHAYVRKANYEQKLNLSPEGHLDLAIENYLKAIELNPNFAFARNGLGLVYWREAAYLIEKDKDPRSFLDKSIESYKKSIEIRPTYSAYSNIGLAAYHKADYEAKHGVDPAKSYELSTKHLEEAIKLNPKRAEAYNYLALTSMGKANLLMNKDLDPSKLFDLAIEYSQKAVELDPDTVEPYYNLGLIYNKKAFYYLTKNLDPTELLEQARENFQAGNKLDPNYQKIYLEQSYLELMSACWQIMQNQDPSKLLNQTRNILSKVSNSKSTVYKIMAESYLWQAQWQIKNSQNPMLAINNGLTLIKQALEIDPEKAEILAINGHLLLLRASLEKNNDLAKEAENLLQKAITTNLLLNHYKPLLEKARNLQK